MASTLTTGGLGSGLDVAGMVAKLVAAERAPADARITKLDKANTSDLTAVSTLRGAMATFQDKATALKDATALVLRTATSGNTALFTATADSTASTGSYDIEVKQLASAAKFTTVALGSAATSTVETGTLAVTQGSTTFNVVINSTNNTLAGLRDAINLSAGTTGVTASLLTASDGVHLQINGGASGSANSLSLSATNMSGTGDVRLASLLSDSRTSATYSAATKVLGNGYITLTQGSNSFTVNTSNTTLQGFVDAVNSAGGNVGIKASLITEASGGVHVALIGAPGTAGTPVSMSYVTPHSNTNDISLPDFVENSSTQAAQKGVAANANIMINGLAATSATNAFSGAIQGVTVNVASVSAVGATTSLVVANNDAAISAKVADFVNAYNNLITTMAGLGGYNATTKTAGAMLGDSMMQTIQTQVRRTATMVVSGGSSVYNTLSAIGVVRDDTNKADVTGKLKVDATKLQAALTADSQSVSKVLAGSGGIATAFAAALDKHTETKTGVADLATREAIITARTKDIAKQKTVLETRIADYKARQTTIFNSLDGMLSKMQTTSSQLTQSLSKSTTG